MSKPEPEFEMTDLIQELLASEKGEEGWRVVDLIDATGLSENTVRKKMRRLLREGRLLRGKRYIEDMSGRRTPVPVYRLRADGE